MKRNQAFFKARKDLAISISEHLFARCEKPTEKNPYTMETINSFLKRGGQITILPPERR